MVRKHRRDINVPGGPRTSCDLPKYLYFQWRRRDLKRDSGDAKEYVQNCFLCDKYKQWCHGRNGFWWLGHNLFNRIKIQTVDRPGIPQG